MDTPAASSVMNVRRLEASDVALVASIDRSEHVEVQYRIEDGRLVEAPVFMAEIPTWDPDGAGEHSVASHIAFCASVVADGAALLGAFDDDGELMGLATVHRCSNWGSRGWRRSTSAEHIDGAGPRRRCGTPASPSPARLALGPYTSRPLRPGALSASTSGAGAG